MRLSVVIPTYRRAESLELCLQGLRSQQRAADEVFVVALREDEATLGVLQKSGDWKALQTIFASAGGQVNQLNEGLSAIQGDVVCITDDDAIPKPDWLQRIEQHFADDPKLGGVGGRDVVHENGIILEGDTSLIGVVQWFGRVVGNHHIGTHLRQNLDILKGANMSYRVAAIHGARFDSDLRGKGAQTCNDMAFSLSVRKRGWRLLFDPKVAVDHFPAQRSDADRQAPESCQAIEDNCFNFYLALRRHMKYSLRRRMALNWAWWVGVQRAPGVVRGLISRLKKDRAGMSMRAAAKRAWLSAKQTCACADGVAA